MSARKTGFNPPELLEVDKNVAYTTSGGGMSERYRPEPLPNARAASELDFDSLIAPAEQWASDVLKRAGLKSDGRVSGTADTPENYAQRFLDYGRAIRASVKRGDSAGAAAAALVLGGFIREAQIKFKWESYVEGYEAYRDAQAAKARKPRGEIADDGATANDLIARLALREDSQGDYLEVADLWNEFLGESDKHHLPVRIEYKRFQNAIAEARKKSR